MTIFFSIDQNNHRGGVACYVKSSLQPVVRTLKDSSIEHVSLSTNTVLIDLNSIYVAYKPLGKSCKNN